MPRRCRDRPRHRPGPAAHLHERLGGPRAGRARPGPRRQHLRLVEQGHRVARGVRDAVLRPTGPQWQASGQGQVVAPERHADPQHHQPGQPERPLGFEGAEVGRWETRLRSRSTAAAGPASGSSPRSCPPGIATSTAARRTSPWRAYRIGTSKANLYARTLPDVAWKGAHGPWTWSRPLAHVRRRGHPRPHLLVRRRPRRPHRASPGGRPGVPLVPRFTMEAKHGQDDERQPDADGLDPPLEPRGPQRPARRRAAHPPGHLRQGLLRPRPAPRLGSSGEQEGTSGGHRRDLRGAARDRAGHLVGRPAHLEGAAAARRARGSCSTGCRTRPRSTRRPARCTTTWS